MFHQKSRFCFVMKHNYLTTFCSQSCHRKMNIAAKYFFWILLVTYFQLIELQGLFKQYEYVIRVFLLSFFVLSRTQTVEAARAEAERVRLIGAAEARAIEAVGRAEAEKMRMKASAYKQYGDAAVMALVLEALPQVKIATTTIQIRKRKFIICSR